MSTATTKQVAECVSRTDLIRSARFNEPIVGIEIGSSKFCVAVGEQVTGGPIRILGIAEATHRVENQQVNLTAAIHYMGAALKAAEEASDVIIRSVHLAVFGPQSLAKSNICFLEMLGLEVCDVAFPVISCAMAVLSSEEKDRGALVIDLGALQTGHIAYLNGEIKDYGWHRGGGTHVTDDLAKKLRIPWGHAERLKTENGNAFIGCHVDAEPMQKTVYLRLRTILEKTKERLISKGVRLGEIRTGVHLTGGGSMQRGIVELVSKVFDLPANPARAKGFVWNDGVVESPQYSCAIGLLKLAELRDDDPVSNSGRRYFGLVPE